MSKSNEWTEGYNLYNKNRGYTLTFVMGFNTEKQQGVLQAAIDKGTYTNEKEVLDRLNFLSNMCEYRRQCGYVDELEEDEHMIYKYESDEYAGLDDAIRKLEEEYAQVNSYYDNINNYKKDISKQRKEYVERYKVAVSEILKLKDEGLEGSDEYVALENKISEIRKESDKTEDEYYGVSKAERERLDDRAKDIRGEIEELEMKVKELFKYTHKEGQFNPDVEYIDCQDEIQRLENLATLFKLYR